MDEKEHSSITARARNFVISEAADFSLLIIAMIIYGTAHGMRAVTEWTMRARRTVPS